MSTTTATVDRAGEVRRWVLLCALAEAVGMTAAAAAATFVNHRLGEPPVGRDRALALILVVAGGLVEGTALGLAQSAALRLRWPSLRRARYVAATVVVAGLGWAAASVPTTLAGSSADTPPVLLVLAGAAGMGLAMGAVLGAVQAWTLRGTVPHPWRWVGACAAAWVPAMIVLFAGASVPTAAWPGGAVVLDGTVAGALAGALLGLLLAAWVPSLAGGPGADRP